MNRLKLQVDCHDAPVEIIERLKTVYGATLTAGGEPMTYDTGQHIEIIQVLNAYGISWDVPKGKEH